MGKPKRPAVLIVDDIEANRTLLRRQLEHLGCRATAVASGAAAVQAVERSSFTVVFMDCWMAQIDGLEATRRIREMEAETGRRTRIVALTANAMEADRDACLAAGMDDFLTKPLLLETLRGALWGVLPTAPRAPEVEDDETAAQLVRTYLAELSGRVRAIIEGIEQSDANGLALAAHTLKSTSVLVGAGSLAELCAGIEASARAGTAGELARIIPTVQEEGAAARARLEAVLDVGDAV